MGREFIIGDLHGKKQTLMDALKKVNFNFDEDVCYSTGDLIDRGENSVECLLLLNEPWFKAARGNHEQMLVDSINLAEQILNHGGTYTMFMDETYHTHDHPEVWWCNKLFRTYDPQDHEHPLNVFRALILEKMPHRIDNGNWQIVHATPYGDGDLTCMWGRHDADQAKLHINYGLDNLGIMPENYQKLTFVGHNVMPLVFHHNGIVYMDTGCGFQKVQHRLSMLEITKELIVSYYTAQMKGQKVWQPPELDLEIDNYVVQRKKAFTPPPPAVHGW